MHPELFRIPFTTLTVKSYGLMMVIGFLVAVYVIRRLSRNITPDPQMITNASLYSLIAGVVGSRIFFVVHHFNLFKGDLLNMFAIWQGGLELLGGVIGSLVVLIFYMRYHKLPVRRYLDILAIGLMLALAFGRIGCFLNGCCFGKPTDLPWAVRFPYGSHPYISQAEPDTARNRPVPQNVLPEDFFGYFDNKGVWRQELKPYNQLSPHQKEIVAKRPYRCLPVHPAQLYSSANAAIIALVLFLFWRRSQFDAAGKLFTRPGSTFALMFMLYGLTRFFLEIVRDDNPFEYGWWTVYKGGTISQNLSIYMLILGAVLMLVFQKMRSENLPRRFSPNNSQKL
ncbi:MAG: prolipoprotein diacylglyceryl transferase [Planctomycetota bacterium]